MIKPFSTWLRFHLCLLDNLEPALLSILLLDSFDVSGAPGLFTRFCSLVGCPPWAAVTGPWIAVSSLEMDRFRPPLAGSLEFSLEPLARSSRLLDCSMRDWTFLMCFVVPVLGGSGWCWVSPRVSKSLFIIFLFFWAVWYSLVAPCFGAWRWEASRLIGVALKNSGFWCEGYWPGLLPAPLRFVIDF